MSPMIGNMLLKQVMPRLRSVVRTIPKIGCEDDEEIIQDATLVAAKMMDSAEKAGHAFTAGNVAYYAAKAARCGRRSYYQGRCDAMSAGCQIDGNARLESMDAETEYVYDGYEPGTLHDVLSPFGSEAHESDPAEEAGRNLDWKQFLAAHSPRHRVVILVLVEGGTMREAGKRCGLKDTVVLSRACGQFTGAEIEAVFIDALHEAYADGREPKAKDIVEAMTRCVPLAQLMDGEIAALRHWAKGRAREAASHAVSASAARNGRRIASMAN